MYPLISPLDIVMLYTGIIILTMPTGLLFLSIINIRHFSLGEIVPTCILAIGFGLTISLLIWWILSLVQFSIGIILIVPISATFLLFLKKKNVVSSEARLPLRNYVKQTLTRINGLFLLFCIVSFFAYSYLVIWFGWSQVGDPWYLGLMTEVLLNQGQLPITYAPLSENYINYPLGFPLLSGIGSTLTGFPPGITMIMIGGFCLAIIAQLLSWLAYKKTSSLKLSSLVFILSFYTHPLSPANFSLLNVFFNGSYPVILGTVMGLATFCYLALIEKENNNTYFSLKGFVILAFFALSIFITYTSFVVIPGIVILLVLFKVVKDQWSSYSMGKETVIGLQSILAILCLGVIAIVGTVYILTSEDFYFFNSIFSSPRSSFLLYSIRPEFFLYGIAAPVMLASLLGCITEIRQKKKTALPWTLFILSILCLLSLIPLIFEFGLLFLLPARLVLFLAICGYVYLAISINHIVQRMKCNKLDSKGWLNWNANRNCTVIAITCVVLTSVVMIPALERSFVIFPDQWDWFIDSSRFEDDLAGILYLREYHNNGLVLNFMSYSDYFLPAGGVLNVIFDRQANATRAKILQEIWFHPTNSNLVESLLMEYSIDFVYVSSHWVMIDLLDNNKTRITKPYITIHYFDTFSTYDFMELRFRQGNCSVFEVIPS